MPHHALIGKTRSGKTTLARALAGKLRDGGIYIAALDPFCAEWPAHYRSSDPESFLVKLQLIALTKKRWAVFVDESSHALDKTDARFSFLATGAAQCGLVSYFIAQRYTQLSPEIRNSVETWWIFNNADGRKLADDLDEPALVNVRQLPQGGFYLVRPFQPTLRGQLHLSDGGKNVRVELKPLE